MLVVCNGDEEQHFAHLKQCGTWGVCSLTCNAQRLSLGCRHLLHLQWSLYHLQKYAR